MIELTKAEIAILSVVIGWLLGQGAELFKRHYNKRKLVLALRSELSDIKRHFERSILTCQKSIANFHLYEGVASPQQVIVSVFDKHYSDVFLDFSEEEREAINIIYGYIKSFNDTLLNKDVSKNQLLNLYVSSTWAVHSIDYFLSKDKKVLLSDDLTKIEEINKEFQKILNQHFRYS